MIDESHIMKIDPTNGHLLTSDQWVGMAFAKLGVTRDGMKDSDVEAIQGFLESMKEIENV